MKRYDVNMVEADYGDYVEITDHQHAVQELEEKVDDIQRQLDMAQATIESLEEDIDRLQKELDMMGDL